MTVYVKEKSQQNNSRTNSTTRMCFYVNAKAQFFSARYLSVVFLNILLLCQPFVTFFKKQFCFRKKKA